MANEKIWLTGNAGRAAFLLSRWDGLSVQPRHEAGLTAVEFDQPV